MNPTHKVGLVIEMAQINHAILGSLLCPDHQKERNLDQNCLSKQCKHIRKEWKDRGFFELVEKYHA